MKDVKSLLKGSMMRAGISEQVLGEQARQIFAMVLREVFGQAVNEQARVKYLRHGVLSVNIQSSALANEIKLQERAIIKKVNNQLGEPLVKRLSYHS